MKRYIGFLIFNLAVVAVYPLIYLAVGRVITALAYWLIFYCFLLLISFLGFIRNNRNQ